MCTQMFVAALFIVTKNRKDFHGSSVDTKSACNAGDPSLILGSGRFPGEGNGNPLQYSCLENPMDKGVCSLQSMGSQQVEHS